MGQSASIVWRRVDMPGHEFARLEYSANGSRLRGVAVLTDRGEPCRVEYDIECDAQWQTKRCVLSGNVGEKAFAVEIIRSGGEWTVNGANVPAVSGCLDVDLGFSPSTNLLPIRRLALAVGSAAPVRAAWVKFPEFTLELLEQSYTRLEADCYRYQSAGGRFRRDLKVDANGFVLEYPDLWYAESSPKGSRG